MLAEKLIEEVRTSNQKMWDAYQLWLNTGGAQGLECLTPDIMEQKLNRTDEEIFTEAEAKGIYIVGKEEYLANKKEKTN